jgi:hypothetical protein
MQRRQSLIETAHRMEVEKLTRGMSNQQTSYEGQLNVLQERLMYVLREYEQVTRNTLFRRKDVYPLEFEFDDVSSSWDQQWLSLMGALMQANFEGYASRVAELSEEVPSFLRPLLARVCGLPMSIATNGVRLSEDFATVQKQPDSTSIIFAAFVAHLCEWCLENDLLAEDVASPKLRELWETIAITSKSLCLPVDINLIANAGLTINQMAQSLFEHLTMW